MTIEISLSGSVQKFLREQAEKEGHESVTGYVQSVLLELQKKQARRMLNAKLRAGVRARKIRMTKERWEKLEREVFEAHPKKARR